MNKIIFLKGLPASGKSTWAKQQIDNEPEKYKRINKDDLRAMLDNGKWSKINEQFIVKVRDLLIEEALKSGFIPIIDDTNFNPDHFKKIQDIIFNKGGGEIEERFFDTFLNECIERDSKREKPVSAKVIIDMYNKYLKKTIEHNDKLVNCIIVDIDGTLSKMNGRSPYEWDKVDTDLPNIPIIDIVRKYSQDNHTAVIVVSGRSDVCWEKTNQWLIDNGVPFNFLYMRPHEQLMEKDTLIKEQIYNNHIKGKYNVKFVLDDRDQVVHLWRGLGLTCLQVDYGNF